MKIYTHKKRWKWLLFFSAVLIVAISLWYTNLLVKKIATDEREKVKIWADAIQRKAALVNYTDNFFLKVREEVKKNVELWAKANKKLISAGPDEDLTFYLDIIAGNSNIPVILTDRFDHIITHANVKLESDTISLLAGELKEEFTIYEPIEVTTGQFIYYKESIIYTELRQVLDDLVESFFSEVVLSSSAAPVIVTDSSKSTVFISGNIDTNSLKNQAFVQNLILEMESQNQPIEISIAGLGKRYIYYKDSYLLTQLTYYPIVQFLIIGLFLIIAYILFSIARKSEQNQVWLGMSKETAHQLGTPLSSLIAWVEVLKLKGTDINTIAELQKDIDRLETITERFSKIGSPPKLINENLIEVLEESITYLNPRTSSKVSISFKYSKPEIWVPLNRYLFSWVIENLTKNSVDAMGGRGKITIEVTELDQEILIDISDTGKGIPKKLFKTIFNPGYTSKKRGWGLGLSLSERIIENYHKGKIFVKSSNIKYNSSLKEEGTTFRIILKKLKK